MGKEFNKKYMHPTRRKLVDMVMTGGEYEKNTTIGYTKAKETHKVGDVWEDENNRYEQKEGYILKTGKNHEALQEIRKYFEEKSQCKNPKCKTTKKSLKDKKFIEKNGYCINCTVDNEHQIRVAGLWSEYESYKVYTRMIVYGKQSLEQLNQSLGEVKPYYEFVNEDGSVEKWELPKSVDETKNEIKEMIDSIQSELLEIEQKRLEAFEKLKEKNYEHYV
jgi:hypothetical protein